MSERYAKGPGRSRRADGDELERVDVHQPVVGELERRDDGQAQEGELEEGLGERAPYRAARGVEVDERQKAFMATTDMMQAKSAFDLNVKSASLLKSMALSSLEIGRGS